jgi:ADP-heptose:LPS heptosyltransferase
MPSRVTSILIAHHLLLGDTAGLAALLAKARSLWPDALIVITVPTALMPLFAGKPYGVEAVAFDTRDPSIAQTLVSRCPTGYDLAIVPGDNRHTVLARAAGAWHVVAFAADTPPWKNWGADRLLPFPHWPFNWADTAAQLLPGTPPTPFEKGDWPGPPLNKSPHADNLFAERLRNTRYAVLHPCARNPLRNWQTDKWHALATDLRAAGLLLVWSGTAQDSSEIAQLASSDDIDLSGKTDLASLWHLLHGARLLVSVDTGVPHVARLAGCPNVTIFGPGSPEFSGSADFFRNIASRTVIAPNIACRNQSVAFKRTIVGMQRCVRFAPDCTDNICMQAVDTGDVIAATMDLLVTA